MPLKGPVPILYVTDIEQTIRFNAISLRRRLPLQ